jgi:glycosyltransferase involved in cell wall biosynthesis
MPRVSVIIPTVECADFLKPTVDSAYTQTYRVVEITVGERSTDETSELRATYGQTVRYIQQPNQGVSATRNKTLAQSSGEPIAYLDADNVWLPHKLARQVEFLDAHPRCGVVHSDRCH